MRYRSRRCILFGYNYDPTFLESTGARLWKGLLLAEERLVEEATVDGRRWRNTRRFCRNDIAKN